MLDYFFDFDGAGGFGNNANEVFSVVLSGGTELISVTVPADAVAGSTFARFRLSSEGNLGPVGATTGGEVEDYAVEVYSESPLRDFGDAPDATYATLAADYGPSHFVGGPYLGDTVDVEIDGQGNAVATGDGSDEDGVHFGDLLIIGRTVDVNVTSSPGGGELDFFIDFNANGVFGDIPSEVFQATLSGGTETLQVAVPADAVLGTTYARFRISSAGGLGPMWMAPDGEVEDYQLVIRGEGQPTCGPWEYFDGVTAPGLPAGWTTNRDIGTADWTTLDTGSDTGPNHAFVPDVEPDSLIRLSSPSLDVGQDIFGLQFRHYYDTEPDWDGGVLEISIDGGPRQDIIAAGGSFVAGGYNSTLIDGWGPLPGRDVWSGNSGGYIDTVVNLPSAAIGHTVQLHWIIGSDTFVGAVGWGIDTIDLCLYRRTGIRLWRRAGSTLCHIVGHRRRGACRGGKPVPWCLRRHRRGWTTKPECPRETPMMV